MDENKYRITKSWGKHSKGEILSESREVRRKLAEGGCLEKMAPDNAKNKMQPDSKSFIKSGTADKQGGNK